MLTKLILRNFKRFEEAEIELGKSVVFIGPNNSGKTTALQALALWEFGLRSWLAKRSGKATPGKRPGVPINRKDLISIPIPSANALWRETHTRNVQTASGKSQRTSNVRVEVIVEGISQDAVWSCGFEFDYVNAESFVCRPVRLDGQASAPISRTKFTEVPKHAESVHVAYLPPMSGLTDREYLKQPGEVGFLIGQGRTADVLRNLCYQVHEFHPRDWEQIVRRMRDLFGANLQAPEFLVERGELRMKYEEDGASLDLSSAGRGLQQTLLLLAHLYANPKTILLLDEPDAHLEILRQRQIYQVLTEVAEQKGSQIIAASHSEVVLNEAAGRGKVVAFVGSPHTINDKVGQVMKSLTEIGWDQYYQAESTGWLLCLEGSTDLSILRCFARILEHPAGELLERPFVHYVTTNLPQRARDLFHGLREAKPDLVGIAVFDRIDKPLQSNAHFTEKMWSRRELENYFCTEEVLLAFAKRGLDEDLFGFAERERRTLAMIASITELTTALRDLNKADPWSSDIKASDEFLDPLFKKYFAKLQLPITFRKADYHELASLMPRDRIDPEVRKMLDAIASVARRAKPRK